MTGRHSMTDDADPEELYTTNIKYSQLVLVSDQDLLDSYKRLDQKQRVCSKKDFAHWQQATGLTWSKHALRLAAKGLLKPVSQFGHDYTRAILQGAAPVVLYHTFLAIAEASLNTNWDFMEQYFSLCSFPKGLRCDHASTLFAKKRVDKYKRAKKFSCLASECLSLYPPIRHFIHTVVLPAGSCVPACQAFLQQAELIDQCHAASQWQATARTSLLQVVEQALATFELPIFQLA